MLLSKLENGECEGPDKWSLLSLVAMVSHLVLSLSLLVYSALFPVKSYIYSLLSFWFLLILYGDLSCSGSSLRWLLRNSSPWWLGLESSHYFVTWPALANAVRGMARTGCLEDVKLALNVSKAFHFKGRLCDIQSVWIRYRLCFFTSYQRLKLCSSSWTDNHPRLLSLSHSLEAKTNKTIFSWWSVKDMTFE